MNTLTGVSLPFLRLRLLGLSAALFLASLGMLCPIETVRASAAGDVASHLPADYLEQIQDWRQRRHERLSSEDGWLTLVGLEWLEEGENLVGNLETSDIRIPGGPDLWGTVVVRGDALNFVPADSGDVTIGGAPAGETVLVADSQGEPTVVRSGDLSFHVISRESYALRIKNRKAPTLVAFEGVQNYQIDPSWRIQARFTPAPDGQTVEIGNVLGQLIPMSVFGTVEFERDGRSHRLIGLGEEGSESLWFLFADRTTGRETYGAGRFLYSDGMPENGRVVVDFNKAYNPPCAFNDYSTCPLPPHENRLDLAVMAGEKDYHHD
jgi:uncharacterized protein (DUF1684 family)